MTEAQKKALETFIRNTADKLGLSDWRIILDDDPPDDDDVGAQVSPIYGRKIANIKVSKDLFDVEAEKQVEWITHELIHLHFVSMRDVIRTDLPDCRMLGQPFYDLLYNTFNRQMEYGIDGLAIAIAPTLGLIPWIDEETTDA